MIRIVLPALAAGLLLATTAGAGDAPRSRGHTLGADMASLAPTPPLDLGQPVTGAAAAEPACMDQDGACAGDEVALDD